MIPCVGLYLYTRELFSQLCFFVTSVLKLRRNAPERHTGSFGKGLLSLHWVWVGVGVCMITTEMYWRCSHHCCHYHHHQHRYYLAAEKWLVQIRQLFSCRSTGSYWLWTCEASRFDSNSNRTSRFDSIRKWRADSKISNRRACHVFRRTINNTHCSTTNFNRFGIATGIYIEFN